MSPQVPTLARRSDRRRLTLAATIAGASISIVAMGAAAWSGPGSHERMPTSFQQQASPGGVIPMAPLAGLASLDATVHLAVDGTVDGKPTTGDLTAVLTSNAQGASQIDVIGSLLGQIVAQVGGSVTKVLRPRMVSVYTVPEGTYIVLKSFFDVCVKPDLSPSALDQLNPRTLMTALTGSDVARGTFVGDEDRDGRPVAHYRIDGAAFLAAAQASADPTVGTFTRSLRSASDADLWVATDDSYPVAYQGAFTGAFEPLAFDGDLTVGIDVTGINGDAPITLPGSCDHAVSV